MNPPCAECGRADPDTEVGWSLCGSCFRADRFDGITYWTPLWFGALWITGVIFLVATLATLAASQSAP